MLRVACCVLRVACCVRDCSKSECVGNYSMDGARDASGLGWANISGQGLGCSCMHGWENTDDGLYG